MSPLYRRIGDYEIRGAIGSGGMADVFVAEDARTGVRVALKVPRQDPDVRRAERDGALLQQHLAERDDRVARVFEIGEDDGVPFVAMEYVIGQDLSERIALGPMAPAEAVRIAGELCDLLATAHACTPPVGNGTRRGIVHGDLKPRNIRIEPGGRVRVVDFGIAKALSETRRLTRNEFGSMPYASPERVRSGNVDAHADLWAIGVVLYEMLTGQPPFHADNPRALEEAILSGERPAPLPPPCSPGLDAVVRKALSPDLGRRYTGGAALRADLDAALRGERTVAEREATERNGIDDETRRAFAATAGATGAAAAAPSIAPSGVPQSGGTAPAGVAAAADDATRRTVPGADDVTRRTLPAGDATRRTLDDATRRTLAANGAGAAPAAIPVPAAIPASMDPAAASASAALPAPPGVVLPAASAPPTAARRARTIVSRLRRALVLGIIALVVNEIAVMNAAGDLESRLTTYGRSDAPEVWTRYRGLRSRSMLRIATWGLSGKVKEWHVSAADDLTSDYLSDTPTIRERGWKQAAALLQRASSIAPGDVGVRARRRYCEGQLARIDAEAHQERNAADAKAGFNTARRAFEEAARLRTRWPDPHLGLARVHAVGFADVDKTEAALREAEQDGYTLGNREVALVADAHRVRAERTWKAVPGLPDELSYLERIREDCDRALQLYDEVPAYGEVSRSIRKVHALRAQVQARIDVLQEPDGFLDRLGRAARDLIQPAITIE